MYRTLVVSFTIIALIVIGLIVIEPSSGPTSRQKEDMLESKFLSYNECVAWKTQKRLPRDDAEVSSVIHCNRIMKMYLTRVIEHGEDYAKKEDERRSYYIK
jgi:hypothetical protein